MKDGKFVVAIDFDGTICEAAFPAIGEILPGAKTALDGLNKVGCKIVIYTCRTNPEIGENQKQYEQEMVDWLKEKELPFDEIWKGTGKPFAHIYIDDLALPFYNWKQVVDTIIKMAHLSHDVKVKEN